jgi:replicative DNA helicase
VAVFSLEMSKESLLRRMLASQAWVGPAQAANRLPGPRRPRQAENALEQLVESRLFIDDTAGISLAEMRAKARRLKQNAGGLDLIVVDYLQLMTATPFRPASGATRTAPRRSRPSRAA